MSTESFLKKLIRKCNKKNMTIIGIILVIVLLVVKYQQSTVELENTSGVRLSECVDGDTAWLLVDGTREKLRFLVVDAPEIAHGEDAAEPYGNTASDYTCNALKNAKEIKLEYDIDKRDKYDRLLAWVWVDGVLLQDSLVAKGYAEVRYVYDDYRYVNQLYETQDQAKENKLGIWG